MPAKNGYTHRRPRWKKGRISMPSWTKRVAMPAGLLVRCWRRSVKWSTEAGPEEDLVDHRAVGAPEARVLVVCSFESCSKLGLRMERLMGVDGGSNGGLEGLLSQPEELRDEMRY